MRVKIAVLYSVLFVAGVATEYRTLINIRYLITYPHEVVDNLLKGPIRIQEDTPIFIARSLLQDDIAFLESYIEQSGFEKQEYNLLGILLILYEAGQYWERGLEMIDRAIQEVPHDSLTYRIANGSKEHFASGLAAAKPPSLWSDIGMLVGQSYVLILMVVATIVFVCVSLKKGDFAPQQKMFIRGGASFLVTTYLGLIYLTLYY